MSHSLSSEQSHGTELTCSFPLRHWTTIQQTTDRDQLQVAGESWKRSSHSPSRHAAAAAAEPAAARRARSQPDAPVALLPTHPYTHARACSCSCVTSSRNDRRTCSCSQTRGIHASTDELADSALAAAAASRRCWPRRSHCQRLHVGRQAARRSYWSAADGAAGFSWWHGSVSCKRSAAACAASAPASTRRAGRPQQHLHAAAVLLHQLVQRLQQRQLR